VATALLSLVAEKTPSLRHVRITTFVAVLGLVVAVATGGIGLYFEYERRQESKPSVRLAFASTWMAVANKKSCWAIGFDALNESSDPITLAKPRLTIWRESWHPTETPGWGFDLIRDTSDDPPGERLPPPIAPNPAAYVPVNGSTDQLTRLDPGEVARYRLPLTNHIVSKLFLPKHIVSFDIRDFQGHRWRHRFTPISDPLQQFRGRPRPRGLARHCAFILIYSKEQECAGCPEPPKPRGDATSKD
jgi:hypothetical protein